MMSRIEKAPLEAEKLPLDSGSFLPVTGKVLARFGRRACGSGLVDLYESGGYRMKFPRLAQAECEGVIINTGGGMTGGDRFEADFSLEADAKAVITTQSAEKIYRSSGALSQICTKIRLSERAEFSWLPQESILFNGCRLQRRLEISMPASARLIAAEAVIFGRSASGELLNSGHFADEWRIFRENKLIFAENTALNGDISAHLARSAQGNGARALATLIMVAPDLDDDLDTLRDGLQADADICALSCWNGMLVARLLASDAARLRQALSRLVSHLRGQPMPRVWQC